MGQCIEGLKSKQEYGHLVRSSCCSRVQVAATSLMPVSVMDLHPLRLS